MHMYNWAIWNTTWLVKQEVKYALEDPNPLQVMLVENVHQI